VIVALIGFMGAGKTTVGHILAERLGLPLVDCDVLIEQREGRAITDIFATEGEAYFRDLEHRTISELVRGEDVVLALGGGAVGDRRTRAVLRNARVVYLHVSYSEAMARVQGDRYRPLLRRPDLEDVYRGRLPVYEGVTAITVQTDGRRPDAVAMDVLEQLTALPELPAGTSSVFVTPVGGAYYSHIGSGLLSSTARLLPDVVDAEQVALIESDTDPEAAGVVAATLAERGLRVVRVAVTDGSAAKTLDTYGRVVERLADEAVHKADLVVAVGGEGVCDLAGFVAATFNRGMKLVLVPTTLGAQADAAVGGKSGLHLSSGHNLVGAIHQPVLVVSDVDVSRRHRGPAYAAGLAEMVKHALIGSGDLLAFLLDNAGAIRRGDSDAVRAAVSRSIEVKADIVSRDEREQGDRVLLNYGHTFAHAMDFVGKPERPDEECLPLGLMAAAHLAFRQGRIGADVIQTHRGLLEALGLPTTARFPFEALRDAWMRDKKYRHGFRFVVLNGLGRPEGGVSADDELLRQVLDDLAAPLP
jgi:3-dehydroquinate synthase/shikimate kinase/3-dehydroquinate synthase